MLTALHTQRTVSTDGKYYSANLGSGIGIAKGLGKDIWIAGDITGSGFSCAAIDFDIQKNTDVCVTGETYGCGIIASGNHYHFDSFTQRLRR